MESTITYNQKGASARISFLVLFAYFAFVANAFGADAVTKPFPPPLSSYQTPASSSLMEALQTRAAAEPFNVVATVLFLLAILHTFAAPFFQKLAHRAEEQHQQKLAAQESESLASRYIDGKDEVSFKAELCHFLGEVEAIFGLWVIPLLLALVAMKDWETAKGYMNHGVNFTEPIFVVIIMALAASRPVLKLAEQIMSVFASLGKGTALAWWLSILTVGPLLGSFITEPAAMTISALLLSRKFYEGRPSGALAYATIGLLFVNVSIGGTLTHFAAPPVLMVATTWGWDLAHMLTHFGWKAAVAIVCSNLVYLWWFRRDLAALPKPRSMDIDRPIPWADREHAVPFWITAVHVGFLAWTVLNNHYPVLFVGGFLFFLAFAKATVHHQNDLNLKPPVLVGFFLAGLVIHGGFQGWWIEPLLSRLSEKPLFFGAVTLTAFNDNAAITYLASLVPNFSDAMKYAVVAGAVVGGGLTVIANAPNPAGQSILARFFENGVSPAKLFTAALLPTAIAAICFLLL